MADMLATPSELRSLLQETALPDDQAVLVLEMATAAVQAAAGQELIYGTSTVELMGTIESWFSLPERPVVSVASVSIDGATVADYKKIGSRLWRRDGWAACAWEPSEVAVTYTHGYAPGDSKLEYAKTIALGVAAQVCSDPTGKVTGRSIDDYREQYAQSGGEALAGLIPSGAQKSLRRVYGARGGLVRIG